MGFEEDCAANEKGWIDWACGQIARLDPSAAASPHWKRFREELAGDSRTCGRRGTMGALIQAAAENPEGFALAFGPVLARSGEKPEAPNPLTWAGLSWLDNLCVNGLFDDWELFLQWRDEGYRVVGEGERRDQDQPLGPRQALRLLGDLTCGSRPAPGEADVDALLNAACIETARGRSPKGSRP